MPEPKEKIIAGHKFQVSQPYEAGHVLTEIEARVLNQVRSENIANNLRKAVKEAEANGTLDEIAKLVAEYDAQYQFTTPSEGGGRRTLDPVEREARSIAREAIKTKLAEQGRKIKDVDPAKLEEAIANLVETNEEIMKLATTRVKQRQKAIEGSLAGLEI